MCMVGKRKKLKIAEKDIVVYKGFKRVDTKLFPMFVYPDNEWIFELYGKTYGETSEDEVDLKQYEYMVVRIDKRINKNYTNIGYHCFLSLKEAMRYGGFELGFSTADISYEVWKFVIPKGTYYRETYTQRPYEDYESVVLASKLVVQEQVR